MSTIYDDNEFPLAYLITLRCYGTWFHGDERKSVSRVQNIYGTPRIQPNKNLESAEKGLLKSKPVELDASRRAAIEKAIREVCNHRGFLLRAMNVRTNHLHTVVTAACKPERILRDFKSYSTRELRKRQLLDRNVKTFALKGSRRYLWKEKDVERAIDYVVHGQGEDLFRLEDEDE